MRYLYFLQGFYDIASILVIVALWRVIIRMRKMIWKPTPPIRAVQEVECELRLIFSEGGRERLDRMRRLINAADDTEIIGDAVNMYERYLELPLGKKLVIADSDKTDLEKFVF